MTTTIPAPAATQVLSFQQFYETSLVPVLQKLDGERKSLVNKLILYIVVCTAVAVPLFLFTPVFLAVIPFVAGGLIYFFSYGTAFKKMKDDFKREVIGSMISFLDKSLVYEPTSYIEQFTYESSKLYLSPINRYKGDDMVKGMLGKTAIRFCELHTEIEKVTVNNDGKRETKVSTVFRGIFFMADFNKKFVGETFILPDVAETLLGSVGTMFQKMNMSRPALVKLEDVEFEKAFAVYSTDQVEARYIISTSLMQRITEFRKKTKKRISISFINSQIFIAIPMSENMFEAPLFTSMVNYDRISEYHNYLSLCTGIVEALDLNTRIWMKE
jgi:hypothetical protein